MFETEKFSLIANNLFLDFVNTRKVRGGEAFETLETFADLLAWAIAVKLIDEEQAKKMFEKWNNENTAAEFLSEAIRFRDTLRETVEKIAAGEPVPEAAVAAVNRQLRKPSVFTEIGKTGEGFEKKFRFDLRVLSNLLQPIAESAADFLCYGNFELLRKCESSACVLYFYDTTKNHKRRWCSMQACGNKAKAAAFYQRKKQTAQKN